MDRVSSDRHTLLSAVLVGGLLAGLSLGRVRPVLAYGAWLVAFSVWMLWFVVTAVEWLS